MEKAVITGATGFLGGALAQKLLEKGITVYGTGTRQEKFSRFEKFSNFHGIIVDFSEYYRLPEIIPEDIDCFYHFAWAGGFTDQIGNWHLQMENAACAGDAVAAAYALGAEKFIYAGTYNQFEILNCLESPGFEPRRTCIYAAAKTAAGMICRTLAFEYGMKYTAGLIPMPYGENNNSRQLANIVIDSLNRKTAPKLAQGNHLYDLVYVDDIARAFLVLGENGRDQKEYYVGHRKLKTFRQWMEDIKNLLAPDVRLSFGEYRDNQKIDYSKIDLEALYRDTGFECKADFRKSILRTAEYVSAHYGKE